MLQLTRVLPVLLVVLLSVGCKSTFELDIVANRPDNVVSLFVVAADAAELEATEETRTIETIVDPANHGSYFAIAQFKPSQEPSGWSWQEQRISDSVGSGIDFAVADDSLKVGMPKGIIETYPALQLAVLINCGARGWRAEKIKTLEIQNSPGVRVNVSSDNLMRVAQ